MDKCFSRLPDGELELMQVLWELEPPVERSALEAAMNKRRPLASTTILTMLSRLAEKGFLRVEKQGRGNLYTPLISRREYAAQASRSFLDRMFGGSLLGFAAALNDSGVSKEELAELRALLEKGEL